MVRKSGAFDLNRCTTRQLAQLSGISLDNARKLVRFRERQRCRARRMEEQQQAMLQRRRVIREEARPRRRGRRSVAAGGGPAAELHQEAQSTGRTGSSLLTQTEDTGASEIVITGSQQVPAGAEDPQSSSLGTARIVSHPVLIIEFISQPEKVHREQGTSTADLDSSLDTLSVSVKEQSVKQEPHGLISSDSTPEENPKFQLKIRTPQDPPTTSSKCQLQLPVEDPLRHPPAAISCHRGQAEGQTPHKNSICQCASSQDSPGLGYPAQEPCEAQNVNSLRCSICQDQNQRLSPNFQSHIPEGGRQHRLGLNQRILELRADEQRRREEAQGRRPGIWHRALNSGLGNQCTVG